jgi:hypothetical protein
MTRVSAIIKNNSTLFSAITDYDLKLVALAWMNYLSEISEQRQFKSTTARLRV